ncbi:hypothetical protein EC957_010422, partial [Mortierella hygrophila]
MATPTPTRRRNLADYSITRLVATDNDPVATILAALQEKKREREQWVNTMVQARALITSSHPDDPKLPGLHSEAAEITYHVQVITTEIQQLQDTILLSQEPTSPVPTSSSPPSSSTTNDANARSPKLTLDNSCSRFGKSEHGKTYPYELESDPFKFLAQFHSHCKNAWGPTFLNYSVRLLNMAIKDAAAHRAFNAALQTMDEDFVPANWDICQKLFVNSVLTPRERHDAVASVAKTGMNKLELFREYGTRLGGIVSTYGIDDGDSTVLSGLLTSLPSEALNNIKLGIRYRRNDHGPVHFDSIKTILSALRDLEGPDQARKRDASAVRNNSDSEDTSSTQSSSSRSRGDKRARTSKTQTTSSTTRNFKFNCKKCGDNNSHPSDKCLAHITCNKCNRTGHLAANCRGGLSMSAWRYQQNNK